MPTRRGSAEFCDKIEDLGDELTRLFVVVDRVTGDGIVTAREKQQLRRATLRVAEHYEPLPKDAAEQDDALACIGALAGAGRVSRYVKSKVNQAAVDAERAMEPVVRALLQFPAIEEGPEAA